MSDVGEVTYGPVRKRALWFVSALGAAGAGLAAVRVAYGSGVLDVGVFIGLAAAVAGLVCLYSVTARVRADAYGLHTRTLLRARSVPWGDVADLQVYVQYGRHGQVYRRVTVLLNDGRGRRLPLPYSTSPKDRAEFDARLGALRALHRRFGTPASDHVPVVSYRSAGHSALLPLVMCALLLAGAGLAAWFVPAAEAEQREWRAAVSCTARTPAAERAECLTTREAVIARTDAQSGKKQSWVYFADARPQERIGVSEEAARNFEAGDEVELTVWRHRVTVITGDHYVWREHFTSGGEVAVAAAVCVLGAGYAGALLLMHRRGRRLPADEILPSPLPFAGALAGTALWLLPLCYLHPTTLFTSAATVTWAALGALASLALFAAAWRATRVRTPDDTAAAEEDREPVDGEVFVPARFLDATEYNPNLFGTHIVLGGEGPAVTPHHGPGRFAAKRIPVERLTVGDVRRVRGSDGDTVPRSWHVAELDDAGTPVRLAAAPADLTRVLRELGTARPLANSGTGEQ
ncbi:PH domain-containing protein [Streptomyces sp. NPDC059785]|uniref:PH domain-containing protein n=1 Tax=Streptomyces sp. NPDC059785 TaxID=3346945 RepID=UPI0036544FC8